MPDMDGIAFARETKKLYKDIPIILLTSVGDDQRKQYEHLFKYILSKPVKQKLLSNALLSTFKPNGNMKSSRLEPDKRDLMELGNEYPLTILVAEDNPINETLATRTLSKLGYAADIAPNGLDVLERLASKSYDLIFMDVQMPALDGLQTTRAIRQDFPKQPVIIAMTANAMIEDKENCLQAGMDDYISKPFKLETIREVLSKWATSIHAKSSVKKDI